MNERVRAWFVSLGCTIALMIFHLLAPTLLNQYRASPIVSLGAIDESYLEVIVHYHETHPVFAGRPLTTWLIELAHRIGHIGYGSAFMLVEGLLFVALGYSLYLLSRELTRNDRVALATIPIFFTSYTVLFAFFASIYTYDEPLQYIGLCLALLFLLRKSWARAAVMIGLALCARETTVIVFPAIAWYLVSVRAPGEKIIGKNTLSRLAAVCLIPLILYGMALPLWLHFIGLSSASQSYLVHDRFVNLWFNFQNRSFAIESLVAPLLTIAWPIALYFVVRPRVALPRLWWQMAAMTFVLNTPIVLVTAYARESRLFALPLLFVWPFIGQSVLSAIKSFRAWYAWPRFVTALGIFAVSVREVEHWLRHVYYPTAPGNFADGYRWYISFVICTLAALLYLHIARLLRPGQVPPSCG